MIFSLRLLGGTELVRHGEGHVSAILRQPKRLALLAYLAVTPGVYHRRDTLVGLFWPEFDQRRARNALNRTLHHLRRDLGSACIASRGSEEVALVPGVSWCDVVAFEDALAAGAAAQALALYRGELLAGFYLSGAPEFERWLDRERLRLRTLATEGALHLAETGSADDLAWARRALEIDPDDERALRRLVALLDASGDRAGALHVFEAFAARMADDYDAEPAPETRALIDAIRAREVPVVLPGDGALDPAGAALSPGAAPAESALYSALDSPFDSQSAPPPRRRPWPRLAALFVLAALVVAGVLASGGLPSARQSGSADGVGEELFAGLPAARFTESPSALDAFRRGERAFRAGRYGEAAGYFERAVREDTAFALAFERLSHAANWTGGEWLARSAADAAVRYAGRLPEGRRTLATAWRAYLYGAGAEAERLARAAVAEDSLSADAWRILGEARFHWGPTYGWLPAEAAAAFAQVLGLEPGDPAALVHLARLAAGEGRAAELDELVRRIERIEERGAAALEVRALSALARRDSAARQSLARELRTVDYPVARAIATSLAVHGGDPAGVAAILPVFIPAGGFASAEPAAAADVSVFAAQLEMARGHIDAANAWLDSTALIRPAIALELRGAFAALPFAWIPDSALSSVRTALERYGARPPARPEEVLSPVRHHYLSGLLAIRAGDPAAARRALARVLAANGAESPATRSLLAGHLDAEIARAAGDPASALRVLEAIPLEADSTLPLLFDHAEAQVRWLRAMLLEELGHDGEALRWYATFPDPAGNDLAFLAPALLRRARIHERLGERERAAELRRRAAVLRRDAEPPLRRPLW